METEWNELSGVEPRLLDTTGKAYREEKFDRAHFHVIAEQQTYPVAYF